MEEVTSLNPNDKIEETLLPNQREEKSNNQIRFEETFFEYETSLKNLYLFAIWDNQIDTFF